MLSIFRKLMKDNDGATAIEYTLIARLPLMTILEALGRRMREQFGQQRQRLPMVEAEDAFDPDRIDVDRFAAVLRMGAYQWVQHGVGHAFLIGIGQSHQLPSAVAAL